MDPRDEPQTRLLYFGSLVAVTILLFVARFLVVPTKPDNTTIKATAGQVIDGLITAGVAAIFVGLGYVLILRKQRKVRIEYLPSRLIASQLEACARQSNQWKLKARTGSYFARNTLPILVNNHSVDLKLQLLDPEIDSLMTQYAGFRSSHPDALLWSAERVRREIYGTILLLALYSNRYQRLNVDIRLSAAFWILSIDYTPEKIFICGQNNGDSAMILANDGEFYTHFADDFEASFALSRNIRPNLAGYNIDELSRPATAGFITAIQNAFTGLGFAATSEAEIKEVLKLVKEKHHYS